MEQPDSAIVARLLCSAGLPGAFQLERLAGGRNNRVYRASTSAGQALLKWYFHDAQDERDRLGAEYAFAEFAWAAGVRDVPQPLACDKQSRLAVYEYIDGQRFDRVGADDVRAAIDFVHRLNEHAHDDAAKDLPMAAEACFSPREHLQCAERRVERLRRIENLATIHTDAVRFVNDQLAPACQRITGQVAQSAASADEFEALLPQSERCLSPSDFGFHNALLTPDKVVRFIDFEYAGWDDPAKLVCDFFCQVEVPVPREYFDSFAHAIAGGCLEPPAHVIRMRKLLPVYRVKWCCIVLNEFLPAESARRQFSGADSQPEQLAVKLERAKSVLAQVDDDVRDFEQPD